MPCIFVLIGVSGVGKTTLAKAVIQVSNNLVMPLGVTTRVPRDSEEDGVDYRFISSSLFQSWKKRNYFIETAMYRDKHYGLLKSDIIEVLNKGFDILTILTNEGLATFEKLFHKQIIPIFIAPPSTDILQQRREQRGGKHVIIPNEDIYGMKRAYQFKIVNDNLKHAVEQIRLITTIVKHKGVQDECDGSYQTIGSR